MFNPGSARSFRDRGRARSPARGTRRAAFGSRGRDRDPSRGSGHDRDLRNGQYRDRRGGHRRNALQRRIVDQVDGRHRHRRVCRCRSPVAGRSGLGACARAAWRRLGRTRDSARPACEPLRPPADARRSNSALRRTRHRRWRAGAARGGNRFGPARRRCLVVHECGLVRAGTGHRDRHGRHVGGRDAAPPVRQGGHDQHDVRDRIGAESGE